MRKLLLVLLVLLAMTLSFVAIGLVMLFATGAVEKPGDLHSLVTGEFWEGSVDTRTGEAVSSLRDAVTLLSRQKEELGTEVQALTQTREILSTEVASLRSEMAALAKREVEGEDAGVTEAQRRAQVSGWFSQMPAAQAAMVMDNLADEVVLGILSELDNRQAAGILAALADDQRKAELTRKALGR